MGRFKKDDVYDLISRAVVPFNHKVIGIRWVYKVKATVPSKQDLWYKDGLNDLASSAEQRFAPVSHTRSQRLLMAISIQHDRDNYMIHGRSEFLLQRRIDEIELGKHKPSYKALEATTGIPMAMRLKQAVYGLRIASRVWYITLDKALKTIGFTSTKSDPLMYIYEMGGRVLY